MNHRDDHKSGPHQAAGVPSSSAVRGGAKSPRPKQPPPNGHALDLPETYGVDEVEILLKDPWWYFAYWEVTETGLAAAREQLGPSSKDARLILRVFATGGNGTANSSDKPGHGQGTRGRDGRDIRDVTLQAPHGRRYLEAPRPSSLLRVAVGLLSPEGFFAPIAHSSLLRVPPQQPSGETTVEWLHVQPARSDGRQHERIVKSGTVPAHEERALPWRAGETLSRQDSELLIPGPSSSFGSSEQSKKDHDPGHGSGRSGG